MVRIVTIALFFILFSSCSRITPAGFWENFKSDLSVTSDYDFGPWGGHRILNWASESPATLSAKEAIAFAQENGWEVVDSVAIQEEGTDDFLARHSQYDERNTSTKIAGKSRAYMFKTGWILVDPGTGEENDVTGFVIVNETGTEMVVYHQWGE